MQQNWQPVIGWMGLSEGGFSNDRDDPGGPTNHGITHKVLAAWRGVKSVTIAEVKALTKSEAQKILKTQYWDIANCDAMPSGIDYCVGDYAVNSGVNKASKDLQRSINKTLGTSLTVDGQIGAKTIDAISKLSKDQTLNLIRAYCGRRWAFMKTLKVWWKYKNGWTTRVMGNIPGVQTDDIGVIDRASMLATNAIPVANIPEPITTTLPNGKATPVSANVFDAIKKPEAWGPLGGLVSAFGALASGGGPIQWALGALIVVFALVGALYAIRSIQNMDPA